MFELISHARRLAATVALSLVMTLGAGVGSLAAAPSASAAEERVATRVVAQTAKGLARSRVVGHTANGREVTGYFVPLKFSKRDGKLRVRGLIHGVVHNFNGTTSRFSAIRTLRVRTIEGVPVGAARTADRATCEILTLVLGPLDLDLLGLRVHLDRVVLTIVAESGPGNLLGNLLCAVAGLLDNNGVLGRIARLLNRILDLLRLGV